MTKWVNIRKQRVNEARQSGEQLVARRTRLVAFGAHPDDLEYYVGGTLCRYARQGGTVIAVVATDGELGGRSRSLGAIRRNEQVRAACILGYEEVLFLGLPDRGLRRVVSLSDTVREVLDRSKPDIVLSFDPDRPRPPYFHPDHRAIGKAVVSVCRRRSVVVETYLFLSLTPNTVVDVSPVWEEKMAALRVHKTQQLGLQLPRVVRPLWKSMGSDSGFPLPPRMEWLRSISTKKLKVRKQSTMMAGC